MAEALQIGLSIMSKKKTSIDTKIVINVWQAEACLIVSRKSTDEKINSFVESIVNIIIGFTIAFISQRLIFPLFDVHISMASNFWITVWFTFISLARSYTLRRFFNRKEK